MKKFTTYVRKKPEIEEVARLEKIRERQPKKEKTLQEVTKKRDKKFNFTNDWFDHNIPRWEKILFHLKNKKINVLEIGVFEGRSTTWILEKLVNHPNSKLIAIDSFGKFWGDHNHEEVFYENIRKTGKEKQTEIIKKNSFDALVELNQQKRVEFNFIYIDGSHFAHDALSDAILSWSLLKDGGVMIFDDYEADYYQEEYNNIRIAVNSFLVCYQPQIEIIYKLYQVAVKKVLQKEITMKAREDKQTELAVYGRCSESKNIKK